MKSKARKTRSAPITDHFQQQSQNEQAFYEMLRKVRPDVYILMDVIDRTRVNPMVVVKFMRQLNNIALGSRWGSIEAVMEDGIVRVIRGVDRDKIDEPALIPQGENIL